MKILTISNLYPPNVVGGYEILCFEVMQALAAKGHEITVLTSTYGEKQVDYHPGQQVRRSLTLLATNGNIYQPFTASAEERAAINRQNIVQLEQTIAEQNPNLIFVWNLYFYDLSLLESLERSGRRLVYLLTDNWLISFYNANFIANYFAREVYGTSKGLLAQVRRLKRACGCALAKAPVFTGSAIFASQFMQHLYYMAGLQFPHSTIIHHGVTPPLTALVPVADRTSLVYRRELRLLFAGRVVEIKGVHTAIEALPHIIKALPQLRVSLAIVGDTQDHPYLKRLLNQVKQLQLDKAVSFAPPVPEADLFRLFQEHDIYLFPSLYEPFSLTLIHALQAGIPTVASTVGGNPEIVLHRQTGMLFAKADVTGLAEQVVKLAHDSKLRAAIAEQAYLHAGACTFARMINAVEAHLLSVRE